MDNLNNEINGNLITEHDPKLSLPVFPYWVPKDRSLGEFVIRNMRKYKIKIALVDGRTGSYVNYEKLLAQVISVAKEMKNQDLVHNDVIAICSRNSMFNTLPIFASFCIGVKPASFDPTLSLEETVYLLKLVEPKFIFCEPEAVDLIESALEISAVPCKIVVLGSTEDHISFDTYLTQSNKVDEEFEPEIHESIDDFAMIMFSSGSTGYPKGLCLPHYGLIYQANMISGVKGPESSEYKPSDRTLNFASTYWISTILAVLGAVLKGDTRIICPDFDVETCLKLVQVYRITSLALSTAVSFKLTQNQHIFKKYKNDSLKAVSVAGGPVSEDHINLMRKLFPNSIIINAYGMTEICGANLFFNIYQDFELLKRKGQSVGRPLPGIHCKIVDVNSEEILGPNKRGELRIKSRCLLKGYYKNETDFKKQFDEEGYLRTGDILYYDNDYCFFVVDRIKEMMKFQSWHVTPATIEAVLIQHPEVAEVMVTGLPHKTDGEHPVAVIVRKPYSKISENELIDYIDRRMADKYRLRGGVKFITQLPKTPTGKIRRVQIRQMILNGDI